jgi:hypothetical protein
MAGSSRGGIGGTGHEEVACLQISRKNQLMSDEAVQMSDGTGSMMILVPYGVTDLVALGAGFTCLFATVGRGHDGWGDRGGRELDGEEQRKANRALKLLGMTEVLPLHGR